MEDDESSANLRRRLMLLGQNPSDETLAMIAPVARNLDEAAQRLRVFRAFAQMPADSVHLPLPSDDVQ